MVDVTKPITRPLTQLFTNRNGAVAIIFALALVPLTVASGLAVDLGRAYLIKNRLSYALDAAGLAVGSTVSDDAQTLQSVAQSFFDANYPASELGIPAIPTLTINDETGLITVTATADVNTLLMRHVGIDTITVEASSQITRETTGLEVVMALDNTGSMFGSKLRDLKTASKTLVDILFGDDEQSDKLFIGVVPFAATVNIGTNNEALLTSLDQSEYTPSRWNACVDARGNGRDQTDDPTSTARWRPYLAPDGGTRSRNNWKGVRGRVFGARGEIRGPNNDCPVALLPLTGVKATIKAKIDQMAARGPTHVNLGAVWAWRVVSPNEPFTQGRPYSDEEFNKAVIIMTDGANTRGSSTSSAYGGSVSSRTLNTRLRTVCSRMRDNGILVYTIAFGNLRSSVRNLMRECTGNNDARFFSSPTSQELQNAFEAIGAELSKLRISK